MPARGRGRIVNVSSGAGFAAVPMLSAYVVSKRLAGCRLGCTGLRFLKAEL
jgi:NAD(P)-dependent dehydrogenase (short-subunit alcohol dehydrogenase family)